MSRTRSATASRSVNRILDAVIRAVIEESSGLRGWKVRVVVLEKDYVETPANGVATIAADEFFNVYDKTGPGMGNYKP
jgi:hypothetical protein